ncbi:MAG: GGDEF domain-containing protein [Alphaproteobacteria bacterium]
MSENQVSDEFKVKSASLAYYVAAFMMVVMISGAIGLQHYTMMQQKNTVSTLYLARYEYALTQRLGFLIAKYRANPDEHALSAIKEANSEMFATHERVAPVLLAEMKGPASDSATAQASDLDKLMREFLRKSTAFASLPDGGDAAELADAIAQGAQEDVPRQWNAQIERFKVKFAKDVDLQAYICFGLLAAALLLLAAQVFALFAPGMSYIVLLRKHIDHMDATDPLSGFYNRTMLFRVTAALISTARRHKQEVSVTTVSIDDFKGLVEEYGRSAGDSAIRAVSRVLRKVLRASDLIGRVSGDEIAVVMPSTNESHAVMAAEKIRAAIEEMHFSIDEGPVALRASLGTAELRADHKTPEELLRSAEIAMRHAFESGGNRITSYTAIESGQPTFVPAVPPLDSGK